MIRLRRSLLLPMLALAVFFGGSGGLGVSAAEEPEQPANAEVFEGQTLTLRAEVEGGVPPFRYLWFKDYSPLPDATEPELKFVSIRASDAGNYFVTVFNDGGSVTSAIDTIVVRTGSPSRLANVSIVGSARDRVIVGFTLGGKGASGATEVLARAAGPGLAQFGVAGALADPVLSVFQQGRLISTNDDWGGEAMLAAAASAVGAFPFLPASKDAAVVLSLVPSSYSAEVVDGSHGTGITVVEVYDTTHGTSRALPRLINISARGITGPADASLTAGFTVEGEARMTVLVRGIGPALERLGVTGALENPKLTLFRGETLISSNENWREVAPSAIEAAQSAVGAFALDASSRDAALLIPLRPGSYTAQVSSTTGSGVAMIEVYEVP